MLQSIALQSIPRTIIFLLNYANYDEYVIHKLAGSRYKILSLWYLSSIVGNYMPC